MASTAPQTKMAAMVTGASPRPFMKDLDSTGRELARLTSPQFLQLLRCRGSIYLYTIWSGEQINPEPAKSKYCHFEGQARHRAGQPSSSRRLLFMRIRLASFAAILRGQGE